MNNEIWKDIPGMKDNIKKYQVSTLGNIRSIKNNSIKLIKSFKNNKGYMRVGLSINGISKKHSVHRLMAVTFFKYKIKNDFQKLVVHHIDGNPLNNTIKNLKCMTYRDHLIISRNPDNNIRSDANLNYKNDANNYITNKNKNKNYSIKNSTLKKPFNKSKTVKIGFVLYKNIIKKIDKEAFKQNMSRSCFINGLLEKNITQYMS